MRVFSTHYLSHLVVNHEWKNYAPRCGNKFGKFFLDKSAHSAKQVEAFRYNDEGIKALRHIIHGQQVA
ncbi:hypothetical protein E7Y21_05945 [Morganella morganii]|nr:hypothetical protein E7Y21_05945 [Morganella morganii]